MPRPNVTHRFLQPARALVSAVALLGVAAATMTSSTFAGEASFTESQVKALFLFNFSKYVNWPDDAYPATNAPIVIGVHGETHIRDDLQKAVAGKTVSGHSIVGRAIDDPEAASACQILFVAGSDRKRAAEILE